jgi:hypothetical protein
MLQKYIVHCVTEEATTMTSSWLLEAVRESLSAEFPIR